MGKIYQNEGLDTSHPAVPDTVSVALAELAGEMREGLLALAVGTGLQVMAAIMEADVTAVRAQGPPRPGAQGDSARPRRRVGDPGRAPGAGGAAADPRGRRLGRGGGPGL